MHAHTNYNISIQGSENEINAIGEVLKKTITDVEFNVCDTMTITETYTCVFDDEVCALAKAMAKSSPNASFVMSGVIDTSESAGEYMDFRFELKNKKLTASFSDWYLVDCMEDYEDYEDFCDCVMECTKEEYESFCEYEYLYTIETSGVNVYSDHVTLNKAVEITY